MLKIKLLTQDRIITLIIIVSALLHLGIYFLSNSLFSQFRWSHEPFHAVLEFTGTLTAFLVAFLLWSSKNFKAKTSYNKSIAAALVGMGALDGFHAISLPGNNFVFLHSLATFLGGTFFLSIFLPKDIFERRRGNFLILFSFLFSCSIGFFSLEVS